jgi:hypothetical protein
MEHTNSLRRIVRHKLTGLYYTKDAELSPYERQAANFDAIEGAIRFCQQHGLLDVDLVVKSAEQVTDSDLICTMRI